MSDFPGSFLVSPSSVVTAPCFQIPIPLPSCLADPEFTATPRGSSRRCGGRAPGSLGSRHTQGGRKGNVSWGAGCPPQVLLAKRCPGWHWTPWFQTQSPRTDSARVLDFTGSQLLQLQKTRLNWKSLASLKLSDLCFFQRKLWEIMGRLGILITLLTLSSRIGISKQGKSEGL